LNAMVERPQDVMAPIRKIENNSPRACAQPRAASSSAWRPSPTHRHRVARPPLPPSAGDAAFF
jgi:hypothetical protein